MAINLDKLFGVHEAALKLRAQRTELIASNLANADTPNYKARDIDFAEAMKQAATGRNLTGLRTTHASHIIEPGDNSFNDIYKFRLPSQPSLDGNTVETQVEQAEFARNAVEYQMTLRFLEGKSKSIMDALKGE